MIEYFVVFQYTSTVIVKIHPNLSKHNICINTNKSNLIAATVLIAQYIFLYILKDFVFKLHQTQDVYVNESILFTCSVLLIL